MQSNFTKNSLISNLGLSSKKAEEFCQVLHLKWMDYSWMTLVNECLNKIIMDDGIIFNLTSYTQKLRSRMTNESSWLAFHAE